MALELADPSFLYLKQRYRIQVVQLFPALPDDNHQARFFKLLQVLCHGLACHVHMLAKGRQRLAVVLVQLVEQAPAGRIGQRFEDFVELVSQWVE